MPRKPTVNWRESDSQRLTKEIERFNAKIYRTRHRHPEIANILPDTIKKADKLQKIEELKALPRTELNKYVNSLERFLEKGAEKPITNKNNVTVTKWEKREVSLGVQQINRERAIERNRAENMEATSQGKSLGMKRGEMYSERLNELKPKHFNFDKIRSKSEWEKMKASVKKQTDFKAKDEKKEFYRRNYLKAMENVYGNHADHIKDIIEKLPADVVIDTYYKEQEASITYHYDPSEMAFKLETLENIWQGVYDEYANKIHG